MSVKMKKMSFVSYTDVNAFCRISFRRTCTHAVTHTCTCMRTHTHMHTTQHACAHNTQHTRQHTTQHTHTHTHTHTQDIPVWPPTPQWEARVLVVKQPLCKYFHSCNIASVDAYNK